MSLSRGGSTTLKLCQCAPTVISRMCQWVGGINADRCSGYWNYYTVQVTRLLHGRWVLQGLIQHVQGWPVDNTVRHSLLDVSLFRSLFLAHQSTTLFYATRLVLVALKADIDSDTLPCVQHASLYYYCDPPWLRSVHSSALVQQELTVATVKTGSKNRTTTTGTT